jgi:hypothetical protein
MCDNIMDAIVVKCAGNEMFNHFDQFAIKLVHFGPKGQILGGT